MTKFSKISAEAQNIVIFFINSMMKKNFFSEPYKMLMVSLYAIHKGADQKILSILEQYNTDLTDTLEMNQIHTLLREYSEVVRYCYNDDGENGFYVQYEDGGFKTPRDLVKICKELANPKDGSSVFVPFANDGAFAYAMNNCICDGFERNERQWALAQILLNSCKQDSSNIKLGTYENDSTNKEECKKYDYIFTFPSLNSNTSKNEIYLYLINLIRHFLNKNGEMYAVLPSNFCSSTGGDCIEFKKYICYNNCSMMVISLPPMLSHINVSLSLIIIYNDGNSNVTLVNASNREDFFACHDIAGCKYYELKMQSLIETINCHDESHVYICKNIDLSDNNLICLPSYYLIKYKSHLFLPDFYQGNYKPISGLIEKVRVESVDLSKSYDSFDTIPRISNRDLSDNLFTCDINFFDLFQREIIDRHMFRNRVILKQDCILIGSRGGKFVVGRTHGVTQETPVMLVGNVLPVKIVSDEIIESYFLSSILSNSTLKQYDMLTGLSVSLIRESFLKDVQISILPKDIQVALCKLPDFLIDREKNIQEEYKRFKDYVHVRKHSMMQDVRAFRSIKGMIAAILIKEDNIERMKLLVSDELNNLESRIIEFEDSVDNLTEVKSFDSSEIVNLEEYFIQMIENQDSNYNFNLNYYPNNTSLKEYGLPYHETIGSHKEFVNGLISKSTEKDDEERSCIKLLTEVSKSGLDQMVKQIIENAKSHGFTDMNRDDYELSIFLSVDPEKNCFQIDFVNNGTDLPVGVNKDNYGKRGFYAGPTGNTGDGGALIATLAKQYGGDYDVFCPGEGTTIRIWLPIKNDMTYEGL